MVRDTSTISSDVQIGTSNPDPETTVEALIRAYNRMALDSDLTSGDLLQWDGSNVVGIDADALTFTSLTTGDLTVGGDVTLASSSTLTWGGDTTLRRDSADVLATDDDLLVGGLFDVTGNATLQSTATVGGDLDHDGTGVGFYGTAPVAQPDGDTPADALEALGLALNVPGDHFALSGGTYTRTDSSRIFVGSVSPVEAGVTPVDGDIWKVSA